MSEIFIGIGIAAIAGGGVLAAFSARRPSFFKVWASAYLVLIVGLTQFGLAHGWQQLGEPTKWLALAAFIIFNIANIFVIAGTALKQKKTFHKKAVNSGGILLAIAMTLLILVIVGTGESWTLVWFLALVIVILISMPIGLILSAKNH